MAKATWVACALVGTWAIAGLPGDRVKAQNDGVYAVTNLVGSPGVAANLTDPKLVNAWGIAASATSPWWVNGADSGWSLLYTGAGVKNALEVQVPGNPTGIVFNGSASFVVINPNNPANRGAARFIFASEDGTISGWNPAVPANSHLAMVAVNNSGAGASYKGLAIGVSGGNDRLYAANFTQGRVDVFDGTWHPVVNPGAFVDGDLPAGYSPFGIQTIGNRVFVAYARQSGDDPGEEETGEGRGIVDAFDLEGALVARVAQHGQLNAPWGLAMAPSDFGRYSDDLLVGNFGNGQINAYRADAQGNWHHDGTLRGEHAKLEIDGLWGIGFGNGVNSGPKNVLYFAAGPEDESAGLFGRIDVVE